MTSQRGAGLKLLPWFTANGRDLPWRRRRTPYRVWVAEIMLQQTRVEGVIPYYHRWMHAFPSWQALARAPQGDVLKCWEGLGYYARARNLHAAARRIVAQYGGTVSRAWRNGAAGSRVCPMEALRTFPGIGPYTAAAIASLAFGEDVAVVDGNVTRIVCRLMAYGGDPASAAGRKRIQQWADTLLVKGRAGECNEAIMDLGAMVCLPRGPKCNICPVKNACKACAGGHPEEYPRKKKKPEIPHLTVGAAVIARRSGEILIAQRRQSDMLGGLWEFPGGKLEAGETIEQCIAREIREELGLRITVNAFLMTVQHAYSHFSMTMHVYHARIVSGRPRALHCADYAWVRPDELHRYPYSKADLHVVAKLQHPNPPLI